jgi:hypothetical protein
LRTRAAAASRRASAAFADDFFAVEPDAVAERVLREPLERVDFARELDALAVERLAELVFAAELFFAPELLFAPDVRLAAEVLPDRDVDLDPPLLACGILSPSWNLTFVRTLSCRRASAQTRCGIARMTPWPSR